MNNYYWNVKCEKCVEEDWDSEDMYEEEENPYIIPVNETDEDSEYGENPAWNR